MSAHVLAHLFSLALVVDAATHGQPRIWARKSILQRRSLTEKRLQGVFSNAEKMEGSSMDELSDKVANKLVGQMLRSRPSYHADLDNTTLQRVSFPSAQLGKFNPFLPKNFMRFALTCAVFFGLTVPWVGQGLAGIKVHTNWAVAPITCLAYQFFLQGLGLKKDEVKKSIASTGPLLFGLITNLLITPLVSILVNMLPFLKQDLRTGFAVFCNLVVTLTPGVSLTTAANGNTAFSLLLIVLTNIIGTFTLPFFLPFQLSKLMSVQGASQIDPFPILNHLIGVVILPTIVGGVVGQIPGIPGLLERPRWKTAIAYSSQTSLALMPWMATSLASSAVYPLRSGMFLLNGLVAAGIHVVFVIWTFLLAWLMRFPADIARSLTIVCSQKTLPLSMMVISLLPLELGDKATMAISCVMGLVSQFIIDCLLVSQMASCIPAKKTMTAVVEEGKKLVR